MKCLHLYSLEKREVIKSMMHHHSTMTGIRLVDQIFQQFGHNISSSLLLS